jgi:DNA-binding NarL/FixJ family response regulator
MRPLLIGTLDSPGRSSSVHVLIIEDETLVAIDLWDMLATSFDFAVTEAEAIASARQRVPDLITSDVLLLEGTGPAAVKEIHRHYSNVPVLFITGTRDAFEPCKPPGQIL